VSERPRVLDQLQAELDRAARRRFSAGRRGWLTSRPLSVAAVLLAVLVLAAAAAAAILIPSGGSLPAPHAQDLLSNGVPLPATARLAGLDAPDPEAGQPPWDMRLSRTEMGETCTAVGQVVGAQFGIVGLDHVFRALPLGGVEACGFDTVHGPLLAGARVFVGRDEEQTRTVVNGVAGAGARSVTAYGPEGARRLSLGPDGSFITVYRGYLEEVRPRIVVVSRSGSRRTIAFAQSSVFEVADPQAGAPWAIGGGRDLNLGAYPDEDCAQATRQLDHANPDLDDSPLTPSVCGRLGQNPLFVAMRRFVPGSGEGSGYPWGENPARTIVYGMAAPRVASLRLSGAGSPRALTIDRREGVFLAVLDGHVDPRGLTLSAKLRDGATITYTGSSNLLGYEDNMPVREAPVPAYREPSPAREQTRPPRALPVAGSVRETLRHSDPGGGAQWALRSWRAVPNPKLAGSGVGEELCFQVGVLRAGTLTRASFPPGAKALGVPGSEERCNPRSQLVSRGALYSTEAFVDDPFAYAPRPRRTIVSGQLTPGATHVLLLGAGAPRPLAVDANHAFLAVLPGRYWDAWLHVAYMLDGRRIGMYAKQPSGFPRTPQARAPDPEESAPWGFALAASGATWMGRIVEGRLAEVDELTGAVDNGPVESGSGGPSQAPQGDRPVTFDIQPVEALGSNQAATLTAPQIERRTLPGRTIVTGIASPDVVSVTLATPSDVRTLRPSGPRHVLIVAYDGVFYSGAATATILLRDGRTVTEGLYGGPGSLDSRPPSPPLRRMLRSLEHQIAVLDANPARPSRQLPGAEDELGVLRRRIAYEKTHPGVLPG
jgi:hypothetical protein